MSHEIENVGVLDNVGLRGEQAWHDLGVVIQDDLTAVEAGERFGLFWPVAGYPMIAVGPQAQSAMARLDSAMAGADLAEALIAWKQFRASQLEIESHVANVRTADVSGNPIQHLLGVVGADYSTCQNRELAEFTDALAQSGKVVIESCGSIRGGKRVWFLARGEAFEIGGTTDKVFPYLLVSNGHDGAQSIRVTPTTVRVVCSNTLHMVIPGDDAGFSEAAISIRHCGKISDKLEQAKSALRYYGATLARNREVFDMLQGRKIDRQQAIGLFAGVYARNWEAATDAELNSADAKERRTAELRIARMEKATQAFLARFDEEKASTGTGDSLWAAFNAATGFIQHDKRAVGSNDSARIERRMESNLFGLNAQRTLAVLADVMATAG